MTNSQPQPLRIPEFPLQGSRLIEASAGTGKTFTIALLYARLVLGHGKPDTAFSRPLTPPELLVVTFTEAATEELKDRIRARLVEAAECFLATPDSAHIPGKDPLLDLRQDYPPEQWSTMARRLQMAAEWMDEAAVSTIHSWCYRMLREHAFDTGNLFSQTLVADQTDLIADVVRDYWRTHCYALTPAEAHEVSATLASPEHLQSALSPWLAQPDMPLLYQGQRLTAPTSLSQTLADQVAWRQQRDALEQAARDAWSGDLAGIARALTEFRPHLYKSPYEPGDDDQFEARLDELAEWSRGRSRPRKLFFWAQGNFKVKKSAKDQEPEHPAFAALAALKAHEDQPPESMDGQGQPADLSAILLAHARDWVQRTLEDRLRQRAELGFNDMLRALDQALQGPDADILAARIRRQFPVAMVDEFQDTDPLQYRILNAIYRIEQNDPDTALVMIGDPKQAIYSFRGADIHTYLSAREATQGRHYTLSRNFRSTTAMVAATNALFEHAEKHPDGAFRYRDTATANPLPFVPVSAQGRSEVLHLRGQPAPAMNLWLQPPDREKDGEEWLSRAGYYEQMADSTATTIVSWLNDKHSGFSNEESWQPIRPADIAILVRGRTEAEHIRKALAARQLPSVYLSDRDSVFATPEASDVQFWLAACADPGSEQALRTALATATLAWPLADLDRLNHDELAWEAQVSQFRDYHHIWRTQGVLPMLHRLMHDHQVPKHLLATPGGERPMTNLLHLAEWLQQASTQVDGEQGLMRHFSGQIEHGRDEQILRLESDANLIKVITVHKSKGLEYPLVMLPFISTWREIDGGQKSVQRRHQGQLAMEIAGREQAPDAWEAANEERLNEDLRLLYVAVTRARHAVWLTTGPLVRGQSKTPEVHRSAFGYALNGDTPLTSEADISRVVSSLRAIHCTPPPPPDDANWQPPATPTLQPARTVQRPQLEHWWIASYSALSQDAAYDEPESPDASTQREELGDLETSQSVSDHNPLTPLLDDDITRDTGGLTPGAGMHRFPRGPGPGTFLHGLLEWAAAHETDKSRGFAAALADTAARRDMLQRRCAVRDWHDWVDTLDHWLTNTLDTPWPSANLSDPAMRLADLTQWQAELEFLFPAHDAPAHAIDRLVCQHTLDQQPRPALRPQQLNGLLKGFIDLVYEHEGRYYVADWKSNYLGPNDQSYTPEAMEAAILSKRYDLQYVIYVLALHRLLRARLPEYDYDQHLGGAVYVFLRGHQASTLGLFQDKPPRALIEALDRLFQGAHSTLTEEAN